jgi:hypothetical protein
VSPRRSFEKRFDEYREAIACLPPRDRLRKEDLLTDHFIIASEGELEIYYAPFDFVSPAARLTVVGITPGWTQMELAFRQARKDLAAGLDVETVCRRAKEEARFAGAMRRNLIAMLDDLRVPDALGVSSTSELFAIGESGLRSCSVIRYPCFVGKTNYTGYSPPIFKSPLLASFVDEILLDELLAEVASLVVPLGKAVGEVLQVLIRRGVLDRDRCLLGFPHPSGANAHRVRQFRERRNKMARLVRIWAANSSCVRSSGPG